MTSGQGLPPEYFYILYLNCSPSFTPLTPEGTFDQALDINEPTPFATADTPAVTGAPKNRSSRTGGWFLGS